jgi:preprotein translocase subunit SecA
MFHNILTKVLGDPNEKELKRLWPIVEQINTLESECQELTDEQLRDRTTVFKGRLMAGESPNDLLPDAFAAVREAARRTIGLRHYDVQLIGGVVLHEGKITEMKTGEGKTLVATLPLYLNALEGTGAHLVTPNDYLAKIGVQWMGPVYHALGLSVAVIQSQTDAGEYQPSFLYDPEYQHPDDRFHHLRPITRREAYQADITYGTNNEFGFDYLRDNMVLDLRDMVQRELNYAIVDEVDNILIDEARTPLIISGPAEESAEWYVKFAQLVRHLRKEADYTIDEKTRTATLTEEGISKVEGMLGIDNLYSPEHFELTPYLENALKAQVLFKLDKDYIVKEGEVIIVDEFTGRLMYGRRYSEGLHQAIEAKEGVQIQRESLTLATITFQNYFRMYKKLAGMTGTAYTEKEEFARIYDLDVVVIPTHKPMIRLNQSDLVYKTEEAKFRAVAQELLQWYCQGRPVLVGTVSVEKSEHLSERLGYAKLQMLARTILLREALRAVEETKAGKGDSQWSPDEWNDLLNTPLEQLEVRDLVQVGRALRVDSNPLANENLARLGQILGIENLERLDMALRQGIPHNILNAKQHEKEAGIIAQAGRSGTITIATNMAGRGVDILLGGNPEGLARERLRRGGVDLTTLSQRDPTWKEAYARAESECMADREQVVALGGLHVLGTERHEARRIDNQLRGRSGRQGDPGSSRFYVSLADELMIRFGGQSVAGIMDRLGVDDDIPIEHGLVSRSIENAQVKVEGYNFDIRKHLLEYDDVINQQRNIIYQQRHEILSRDTLRPNIMEMVEEELRGLVATYTAGDPDEWDLSGLVKAVNEIVPLPPTFTSRRLASLKPDEITATLLDHAEHAYDAKERQLSGDLVRQLEKLVMLRVIDTLWIRHLTDLDELRTGIGLRAFGQLNPLVEYKREAYGTFERLTQDIQHGVVQTFFRAEVVREPAPRRPISPPQPRPARPAGAPRGDGQQQAQRQPARAGQAPGRNDPCWCGSGKKYKHCHMRQDMGQGSAPVSAGPAGKGAKSKGKRRR